MNCIFSNYNVCCYIYNLSIRKLLRRAILFLATSGLIIPSEVYVHNGEEIGKKGKGRER